MKTPTRAELFNLLTDKIRKTIELEDEGYTLDDHIYGEGAAYWYYSPTGEEPIRANKTYEPPVYPYGDWIFIGLTLDGTLVHEETRIVEQTLLDLGGDINEPQLSKDSEEDIVGGHQTSLFGSWSDILEGFSDIGSGRD